jgi:hypothetical protein
MAKCESIHYVPFTNQFTHVCLHAQMPTLDCKTSSLILHKSDSDGKNHHYWYQTPAFFWGKTILFLDPKFSVTNNHHFHRCLPRWLPRSSGGSVGVPLGPWGSLGSPAPPSASRRSTPGGRRSRAAPPLWRYRLTTACTRWTRLFGYPNSWMVYLVYLVYNGKAIYKWMIHGLPYVKNGHLHMRVIPPDGELYMIHMIYEDYIGLYHIWMIQPMIFNPVWCWIWRYDEGTSGFMKGSVPILCSIWRIYVIYEDYINIYPKETISWPIGLIVQKKIIFFLVMVLFVL